MKIKFADNDKLILVFPALAIDIKDGLSIGLSWLNWHIAVIIK